MIRTAFRQDPGGRLNVEAACGLRARGSGERLVLADGRAAAMSGRPVATYVVEALLDDATGSLDEALDAVHHEIRRRNEDPSSTPIPWAEMVCTAVVVDVAGDQIALAQVGDVRVYHLRGGQLARLTEDHTLAALRGAADAPPGSAQAWGRMVVTESLGGGEAPPKRNLRERSVEAGDRLLVTTGTLVRIVPDEAIAAILGGGDVDAAADALLREGLSALARAGQTGVVTVCVVDVA